MKEKTERMWVLIGGIITILFTASCWFAVFYIGWHFIEKYW